MDVFSSRGVNLFRILLVSILVFSLFCFRDLWLPIGNDEYAASSPLPRPTGLSAEDINHGTNPSLSTEPPAVPATPQSLMTTPTHGHEVNTDNKIVSHDECRNLPGADKVMVMLKTGATEIYSKLPTHLLTTFTCIDNFKIYSDLEQTFAQTPIYDVIAPVSKNLRENHPDFKLYQDLQKWQREGQDLSKLQGANGWNLDKWKFLPMLHHAYESAGPEIEWFVMIEADTALSWLNIIPWLQTMNPKKPYYLGAENVIGDIEFAHGGSGVVISRGAMDTLEGARTSIGKTLYDEKWEQATTESCCGDAILAEALKAVGIPLTRAWPIIQGETISTIDFTADKWCAVPTTWHHVSPIQVDAHWQFQTEWTKKHGWDRPFQYRDVFERFVAQHVSVNRTQWNNLSGDDKFVAPGLVSVTPGDKTENRGGTFEKLELFEQRSVESEELCAEACVVKGAKDCVQWMWSPGRCYLGRDVRLGSSDERGDSASAASAADGEETEREHWNCGWVQERVEKLTKRKCPAVLKWGH